MTVSTIPPEGDDYNKQREEELYASITNKAMLVRRHAEMLRADAPLDQIAEAVAAMAQIERDIARLSLELHNSTQGKNLNIFLMRFESALAENASTMQQMIREKSEADTLILAGVNNNLTLYNLTLEEVLTVSRANETRLSEIERRLSSEIGGLRSDGQALQAEFRAGLSGIQATVGDLQAQMRESQADRQAIHEELAGVESAVAGIKQQLTAYIAGSKRADVEVLQREVREMRGDYTQEERADLTSTLLRMIMEYRSAHPDVA